MVLEMPYSHTCRYVHMHTYAHVCVRACECVCVCACVGDLVWTAREAISLNKDFQTFETSLQLMKQAFEAWRPACCCKCSV